MVRREGTEEKGRGMGRGGDYKLLTLASSLLLAVVGLLTGY